jgi:hypothetical protein
VNIGLAKLRIGRAKANIARTKVDIGRAKVGALRQGPAQEGGEAAFGLGGQVGIVAEA